MMGGDVTLQSVPGKGSVFTIKIPADVVEFRTEGDAVAVHGVVTSGTAVENTETPPDPGTCVLVIDDDVAQRELMKAFLQKEGFCVYCASSGAEGLKLAKQLRPVAITLDVMMPEMDGWVVLEKLKHDPETLDIPVVMLTMVDDPQRGFTLGAADYATKPVNRRRLARIIKKYACANPPCPVLVVEDDAATRALTRNMLEKEGCRVLEAENGEVALEVMKLDRPSLILLDLMMPVMDGFEFADRVRAQPEWRSIPIVVVTAHDLTGEERRRLSGYVETILHKVGGSREELLNRVRNELDNFATPRLLTN